MATTFDPYSSNLDPSALTALKRLDLSGPRTETYISGVGEGEMTLQRPIAYLPEGYGELGGDGQVSGFYGPSQIVNGVTVVPYYDAEGNLVKYVGGATKNLSDSVRLSAEWDPTGTAAPVQWNTDNGLFNSGVTFDDAVRTAIIAATAYNALGPTTTGAEAAAAGGDAAFVAADASQLAAQGLSQAAIEQNLIAAGVDSFIAADAAQLATQGLSASQITSTLTAAGNTAAASGGLTAAQIANLARAGISLAGVTGAANAVDGTGGGGLLTNTTTDRSGTTSGTADYGNPYYQAIQSKYNQYMPQAQGKDITTDLKNWYETKYVPNAKTSGGTGSFAGPTGGTVNSGLNTNTNQGLFGLVTTPLPLTPGSQEWVNQLIKEAAFQAGGTNGTLSWKDAWIAAQRLGITEDQLSQAMQDTGLIKYRPGTQEYVDQLIKEAALQAGGATGTLSYTDAWNAAQRLGIDKAQFDSAVSTTGKVTGGPLQTGSQDWVNQLVREAASQAGGTLSYNDAVTAAQRLGITQAQIDAAMAATGKITPNVAAVNTGGGGGGGMLTGGNTATTVNTNTANTANTNTAGNASTFQASNQNSVNQLVREAAAAAGGTLSYNDAVRAAANYGITPDQITAAMSATGVITR